MPSILDIAHARGILLRHLVWPNGLPSTLATSVEVGWNGVTGVTGLASTDRWTIVDSTGQSKEVWLMHPAAPDGTVVVMHSGHIGDDPKDTTTKSIDMLQDLLAANKRVLALSMPGIILSGAGTTYNVTVDGVVYPVTADHNDLKACPSPAMLRVFVEPVVIAINQARALYPAAPIFMVGISGGGWTTAFAAALDTRISRSYPVCGSMPFEWMRVAGGNGDWEQHRSAPWFRLTGLDYDGLWALALGTGRRQRVCFNNQDPEFNISLLPATYLPNMQTTLATFGTWNYTNNTGADVNIHCYSATICAAVLDDMAA